MERKTRKERGITLIALIITIVILILVAGISISQISGDGLVSRTLSAREQAEIQGEKETIQAAVVQAKARNRYGKLTKDELEEELNESGNTAEVTEFMNNLIVHLTEKDRYYETTKSGQVTKMDIEEADVDVAERFNNGEYTWQDIHEMAKIISGMYESGIDRTSGEVEFIYNKKLVKLTVGDEFDLVGKIGATGSETDYIYRVRIIGFNTDKLAGDSKVTAATVTNTTYVGDYAGITFQFVNLFSWDGINEGKGMNSSNTNVGGWESSAMKTNLNLDSTLARLTNSAYIKYVDKLYLDSYTATTAITGTPDRLWLLAASEVFPYRGSTAKLYGCAKAAESEVDEDKNGQYKWYKDNVKGDGTDVFKDEEGTTISASAAIKKGTNYTANPANYGGLANSGWWLRSIYYWGTDSFCYVYIDGGGSAGGASSRWCVSPGFCI